MTTLKTTASTSSVTMATTTVTPIMLHHTQISSRQPGTSENSWHLFEHVYLRQWSQESNFTLTFELRVFCHKCANPGHNKRNEPWALTLSQSGKHCEWGHEIETVQGQNEATNFGARTSEYKWYMSLSAAWVYFYPGPLSISYFFQWLDSII